jgi:lycopene beta-cyclase
MRNITSKKRILIAGAGAAGMSLAWHLMDQYPSDIDVILLDPNAKQKNDRTWCYWSTEKLPVCLNIKQEWNHIRLGLGDLTYSKVLHDLTYYCVQSSDFYKHIHEAIKNTPNFRFVRDTVTHIQSDKEIARVYTSSGQMYEADWVFDSRPQVGLSQEFPETSTWQHFVGLELETTAAVFNPEEVTLMDFAYSAEEGVQFIYVLPFSETTALVELTAFSNEAVDEAACISAIHRYVQDTWDTKVKRVIYTEKGSIPMTAYRFDRRPSPRVMRIGTAGGATRASTGYTFANIQRDSAAIVQSLTRHGHPFHGEAQSLRARFYDRILLDLMHHEPQRIPKLFYDMFRKNSPDSIFRFLDGQTTLFEELLILLTLPWPPFLKALYPQFFTFSSSQKSLSPTMQSIRSIS